jgi:histidinol-phosphate aminotransferase
MTTRSFPGPSPRPGIREIEPYDSPQPDVAVRLNTNESPFPLPAGFFEDLSRAVCDLPLNRYPDGRMTRLREELAEMTGQAFDAVWPANGSNEILTQLLQAYGGAGRRALVFDPTYALHTRLSWLTQTELVRRRLPADFVLSADEVEQAREAAPNVVFVCSPNNPTGGGHPVDEVRRLAEELPGTLLIVDEAYGEFSPEGSALPLVAGHPNVAVVRTFSKAFALAGARIGYVITSPAVVKDLERVRLPYHLSALTQATGVAALRYRSAALEILDRIRSQRDRILARLAAMPGTTVYPSDANFVLFAPPGDAGSVWRDLLARGVLIRDVTAAVPGGLRVTAGTEHETDRFLEALEEVVAT